MSVEWAILAGFLYFEIAIVTLLVLPVASPRRWQRIFNSRFFSVLQSKARMAFLVVLAMLAINLFEAIRKMRKYNINVQVDSSSDGIRMQLQHQVELVRAQRNFYIAGFSLFLSLVIYRLVWLISSLATSNAQNEASLRQAQGASAAARNLLNQTADAGQNAANEAHEKKVENLGNEISKLKEELAKEKKNLQALKQQAEATNKEYDRLTSEYSKLEKKVAASAGDKKDD